MSKRSGRSGRSLSDEFKAEAVSLVQGSGKSVARIAKDLDLTETALRRWVRDAECGPAPEARVA
jgi:transposase